MGNALPSFIPLERPQTSSIIDPGHKLNGAPLKELEETLNSITYPAYVIVLPDNHGQKDIVRLSNDIEKQWSTHGQELIFILDIQERQLNISMAPGLLKKGVSRDYINNAVLPTEFYPAIKQGHFAEGISKSLRAVNSKALYDYKPAQTGQNQEPLQNSTGPLQNSTNQHQESSAQSIPSSGNQANEHSDQLFFVGGALFLAVVILIVITYRFKGKDKAKNEIDLRKSRDEYNQRMEKIKVLFEENPKQFFTRVVALILLGYVYIAVSLVILISFTMFAVLLLIKLPILAFKLAIPLILVIGVIFRSFWIKMPPVDGIPLKKKDFPELHKTVEEIRSTIKAPPVHQINLIPDLNAAVHQRAQLGMFGWQKNYLMVGLELLKSCSYDEVRSILAHEMGHLAGNHGAKSAWIYRIQNVWYQLMQNLQNDQSMATLLFTRFFDWYVPLLDAYTFPYRRQNEYSADLCSVDLVGADKTAKTLVAINLRGHYLDKTYWSSSGERFIVPEPPNVYTALSSAIQGDIDRDEAESWLKEILSRQTDYEDSHPCTRERIATVLNIKQEEVAVYVKENLDEILRLDSSAFDILLSEKGKELCQQMDREYKENMKEFWTDRHNHYLESKETMERLTKKQEDEEPLSEEETIKLACAVLSVKGFKKARPYFEEALAKNPNDAEVREIYGEWLLSIHDPDCVTVLEEAIKLERSRVYQCGQMLYGYFKSIEDEEKTKYYDDLIIDWLEEYYKSKGERTSIEKDDIFIEHDLSETKLEELKSQVRANKNVKKAYLVRKKIEAFKEYSLYVLVVDIETGLIGSDEKLVEVVNELSGNIKFDQEVLIMNHKYATKNLKNAITMIANAVLF